jgi:non-homologous end joining protein Ku
MLDEKSKGKEVTMVAPASERGGKVVNIMAALKRSMERVPAKRKPAVAGAATCNSDGRPFGFYCS